MNLRTTTTDDLLNAIAALWFRAKKRGISDWEIHQYLKVSVPTVLPWLSEPERQVKLPPIVDPYAR